MTKNEKIQVFEDAIRVMEKLKEIFRSELKELKADFQEFEEEGNLKEETQIQDITNKNIINVLHDLGIPAHYKGYQYICEAIMYLLEVKNSNTMFRRKDFYPNIAKKLNTTPLRIKSSIKNAIEIAWDRDYNQDFKKQVFMSEVKPGNIEFILTIVEYLRMH